MSLVRSWKKSRCSQNGGDCVEVANTLEAIRDSKHPDGVVTADVRGLIRLIQSGALS